MDIVFPFVASYTDTSSGSVQTFDLTWFNVLYTVQISKCLLDCRDKVPVVGELVRLRPEDGKF